MCGIVATIGKNNPEPILYAGLKNLEYRGYDSAGFVTVEKNGETRLVREIGEVSHLLPHIQQKTTASTGIGHTRWATHGGVTEENTHPHYSMNKKIYLVHNGIIENYKNLSEKLQKAGYKFYGQTDSEVLANLIEYCLDSVGDVKKAILLALSQVAGTYGLAVISPRDPTKIYAIRRGSPLMISVIRDGIMVASDPHAFPESNPAVIAMEDGELATLHEDGNYSLESLGGEVIDREAQKLEIFQETSDTSKYEHSMLGEIMEQGEVIENTIRGRINFETEQVTLGGISAIMPELLSKREIIIVACGTSYYAGLVGKNFLQEIGGIPCRVEIASEFRYSKQFWNKDSVLLVISQSGETADTLAALREAKHRGILTLGIVNVPGSTIAQETDAGIFTHAGKEVGVASTKAFTAQITALLMMAIALGERKELDVLTKSRILKAFRLIPDQIRTIISNTDKIKELAEKIATYDHCFFLGRYYQHAIACEGSIKLKEITYIHSEAYPAGELKHGPLALISDNFPSIVLNPTDALYDKTASAIHEVEARRGPVYTIGNKEDSTIQIPETIDILYPFLTVIPCQLIAYYTALKLGRNIDKPRNLAKSVTVE
ncbi:glutamine--fructose-6-phosphate transaminase (isomerizing) [Candidatus Gracilibacteria bacterium]|nr:glutamine--fructose-6-phosphate transaminase (isomerizing) [Candidatus Gracilibacteria bacterium]